jgi:drug/metabolite transporter (DMT)-like permease
MRGALSGIAAVSIWAGWIVAARFGVQTNLTPWDIAALRFSVAGMILMPVMLHKGFALDRLGWTGLVAIVGGGGAPMVLVANAGLLFAPAAHGGALFPGVMPLMVAILASIVLKEQFSTARRAGLLLILVGVLVILGFAGARIGSPENVGHAFFMAAAALWAFYTVAMRRAGLDGLHAAAIAAVTSLLVYVPICAIFGLGNLAHAPVRDVAVQAIVQGVLTAVVSLMLYGYAVTLLGAAGGAAFGALCPVMTALMAVPILGEWPAPRDWIGIGLIALGVYFVGGGPLPNRLGRTPGS